MGRVLKFHCLEVALAKTLITTVTNMHTNIDELSMYRSCRMAAGPGAHWALGNMVCVSEATDAYVQVDIARLW